MTAAEDRLGEIEGRAAAATEGPWDAEVVDDEMAVFDSRTGCDFVFIPDPMSGHSGRVPNAAFIAHTRTDVPLMAAALRAVLALCDAGDALPVDDNLSIVRVEEIRDAITAALTPAEVAL